MFKPHDTNEYGRVERPTRRYTSSGLSREICCGGIYWCHVSVCLISSHDPAHPRSMR